MLFAACHAVIFAAALIAIGATINELIANRRQIARAVRRRDR